MKKFLKHFCCLFAFTAIVASVPIASSFASKEPSIVSAEEGETNQEPPVISKERLDAIKNSGSFFNLNYEITYNYLTLNDRLYKIIQNGASTYLTIMKETSNNQPYGTKNPVYVSSFISDVIGQVFVNNPQMDQILRVCAEGADTDNAFQVAIAYINLYIPRFMADMINLVLTDPESPYDAKDLKDFDYFKLLEDYDSLQGAPRPTPDRLNTIIKSGGFYNIHYQFVDYYLKGDDESIFNFALTSHEEFRQVAKSGMILNSYGTKNPEFNNQVIADLIETAIAAQPGILEALGVYGQGTFFFDRESLLNIYATLYLPIFFNGLQKAIDQRKNLDGCPELIANFQNYEVKLPTAEEAKGPAKVPYYWIIVAGAGAVVLTSLTFVLVYLGKKKRKQIAK